MDGDRNSKSLCEEVDSWLNQVALPGFSDITEWYRDDSVVATLWLPRLSR